MSSTSEKAAYDSGYADGEAAAEKRHALERTRWEDRERLLNSWLVEYRASERRRITDAMAALDDATKDDLPF